jgi:hypothetical protein
MEPPRCCIYKSDGHRCENRAPAGQLTRCGTHERFHATRVARYGAFTEGSCQVIEGGHWCPHPALTNNSICDTHLRKFHQKVQREERARRWRQERDAHMALYEAQQPPLTWQQVMDMVLQRTDMDRNMQYEIMFFYFHRHVNPLVRTLDFHHRLAWIRAGRVGPEPLPEEPLHIILNNQRTLQQIAADRQNVHTTAVTQQTNAAMEKLLQAATQFDSPIPAFELLAGKWLYMNIGWKDVREVADDMQKWYNKATCRSHNDELYKKALTGVVHLIRTRVSHELRHELYLRAFEECEESVDMCCEGHISRLCNIFTGFDETFQPPVSVSEQLQNKLGAIALLEISTEEKIQQATQLLNELNVPEDQRAVWLEAF